MSERPEPVEGKIVEPAKQVSPLEGLSALSELVEVARETFLAHDVESTKRERLRTYRETEVARIKAAADELRNYLNLEFAARRSVYEGLFARLDRALDEGNNEALHEVVVGIVDLAKTSPLAALGDLSQLRAAFDDPNQVWEL
jgi:hypothetical protein